MKRNYDDPPDKKCLGCGRIYGRRKDQKKKDYLSQKYCCYECSNLIANQVPLIIKFWNNIRLTSNCWIWKGKNGWLTYGSFNDEPAHRYSYKTFVGPIPKGLVLDHLCRNPPCVRPDHLEAVTQRENTIRGIGPSAKNAAKTVCINGHPFNDRRTRWGRRCNECLKASAKAYYWKNAERCRKISRDYQRRKAKEKCSKPS